MRYVTVSIACVFGASLVAVAQQQPASLPEAPAGFDNQTNGFVDQATFNADRAAFDEFENVGDGLGPLYNAQSCRECHQVPTSGGSSQVTELRVGHRAADGSFQNPSVPIAGGAEIISTRTLINDRAICPSGDFPNSEIYERVPDSETIRTFRLSLGLLGDGFVEAVPDSTLIALAQSQCQASGGRVCGQVVRVPILEAPGATGVGRFGWKNQHASLLSFSADAYLNEMGITSRLQPDEVTNICNTVGRPNDPPAADGLDDVDHFARFIRATKAPARDVTALNNPDVKHGAALFDQAGCSTCHVPTLTTAAPGTAINGGAFKVPPALGNKQFHPFSDFLLHNVGTGDGIAVAVTEHFGRTLGARMGGTLPPGHRRGKRGTRHVCQSGTGRSSSADQVPGIALGASARGTGAPIARPRRR